MSEPTKESTKRVAIQGTAGAFHELAAYRYFGDEIEVDECKTFSNVCQKVSDGESDFGIMAIENTIAGSLLQNYSLLNTHQLKIVGEIYLHIEMQLIALPGVEFKDIEHIISHPIAIAQCREFLDTLPPHIKISEASDTAGAAQTIRENELENTAAIAGINAAELYDLDILVKDIHTNKQNFTRFLVLSTQNVAAPKNNKSSICFEVAHRSGSLAEVLTIWSQEEVNLTKIQSVPIIGKPYQYWFYVDLEWNNSDSYRRAMYKVMQHVISLSILGEYEQQTYSIQKVNKM